MIYKYRVDQILERKEWSHQQYGPMVGWYLALTRSDNQKIAGELNSKPNNEIQVGDVFDAEEQGPGYNPAAIKLRRVQPQQQRGSNALASAPFGAPAPSGASFAGGKTRIPYQKAVDTFRRIQQDFDRPEDAVCLFLGWVRGEIDEPGDEPIPF